MIELGRANPTRFHGDGTQSYPSPSQAALVGLCTGSFAAAAISTSTAVVDLVPAALEAVLVAFKTGLRSIETRNDLERIPKNTSPSWSAVVSMEESQALKELDAFSVAKVGPAQPYFHDIG